MLRLYILFVATFFMQHFQLCGDNTVFVLMLGLGTKTWLSRENIMFWHKIPGSEATNATWECPDVSLNVEILF